MAGTGRYLLPNSGDLEHLGEATGKRNVFSCLNSNEACVPHRARLTASKVLAPPLIGNAYLYYLFDLWADVWCKKTAKGDVIIVRYADDVVLGSSAASGC
jgi:hypothetical protein